MRQAAAGFSRRRVEDAPYKPGDTIALRYAVREVIGAGPLGFVLKAHDQDMDVEVALKVVHPRLVQAREERTQFSQVLRTGRRLTHPHLLRVYEEGLDGDCPYFTMQLLGGMSLRKLMEGRAARGQRFVLKELEGLLAQVCSALDAAHQLGPHADLKPENILVLPDMVKVTDYGLGLAIPRLPFIQAQKQYRADAYLAPEYVSGGEFDARMDIYSLAVIVGELLTGLLPVEGAIPELRQKVPEVPASFEALYRRSLNPNPLARPQTAGEFLREFFVVTGRIPAPKTVPEVAAPPAPPPVAEQAPRPRPRGGSGAHAGLAASERSDKPPPPVPTDQLPVVPAARPAARVEPPIDATQPMDAATVLRLVGQSQVAAADATQPMDAALLAAIVNSSPALASELASATVAPSPFPAQVTAPAPVPPPAPVGVAAPAPAAPVPARPAPRAPKTTLWLAVLAVAGLVTGSVGGYFVLRGKQQPDATQTDSGASADAEHAAPAAKKPCRTGMRLIPAGPFPMGTAEDERTKGFDERPLAEQQVAAFCMDEYEFPNVPDSAPRVGASWNEAKLACERVGKRLCKEEEWEKACKGPGHSRFPYGNTFDANACNTEDAFGDDRSLAHSGKFPKCRSGYGVADLSGNVAEWTATTYPNNADMTQKGGAFDRPDYAARCSARKNGAPGDRAPTVGFRCCADVTP